MEKCVSEEAVKVVLVVLEHSSIFQKDIGLIKKYILLEFMVVAPYFMEALQLLARYTILNL